MGGRQGNTIHQIIMKTDKGKEFICGGNKGNEFSCNLDTESKLLAFGG